MNRLYRTATILAALLALLSPMSAHALVQRSFTLQEPCGLSWGPDRVNYTVEFPRKQVVPGDHRWQTRPASHCRCPAKF